VVDQDAPHRFGRRPKNRPRSAFRIEG
jgi:hypothetical protein